MRTKIAKSIMSGLALIGLLLCDTAHAQIFVQDGSLDTAATSANSTSVSTSFTVTTGAQALVVSLYDRNQSLTAPTNGSSPSSLSWGPQTITRVVSINNLNSHYADSDIYYLWNPTPGTQTVTATDTTGQTPSAMTMQVFTLNGVNTNVAPVPYGVANANIDNIHFITLTLSSSTPSSAWAVINGSAGDNGSGYNISSSGGITNYDYIVNNQSQIMGAIEVLPGGATTITNSDTTANSTQTALAVAVFAPAAGVNTNIVTPQFSNLTSPTTTYGAASVTLTGTVSSNNSYLPQGAAVTVTVDGKAQQTTIDDSTGDFSINFNTMGIPASMTPYSVTYTSAAAAQFNAATNTSTTLTINPLPVVLSGYMVYNGTTTVPASNLTVANLVDNDNLTLSGSVTVAGTNAGPEAITSFTGLTLGGTAAANYTLTGASGSVTMIAPGGGGTPGLTNWIGIFNGPADINGWTPMGGSATCSLSFLAGDAPPWGPSSGALVMQVAVPTSGMYCYFGKSLGSTNLGSYAQLEFDVKVGSNQTVWSIYSTACNNLIPTIQNPGTVSSSWQPAIYPTAGNNGWQHMVFPASDFSNLANVQKMLFEMVSGPFQASGTMDLEFANIEWDTPASAVNPTITLNPSNTVRTADARWLGINTGGYDQDFNLQHTVPEAQEAGWAIFRYPGGSGADTWHWQNFTVSGQNNTIANYAQVVTNLGAQLMITVNYGTGTPQEAAAWVAYMNITNHYGVKYWEVGNEVYAWPTEVDSNSPGHNPYEYATRAAQYIQQMKAADPTIKVGVVIVPGELTDPGTNDNVNVTNLVTGQVVDGWEPVVMSTLRQLGATPDFVIYHYYPENGTESDPGLLATANWAGDAAEIRGEINDFFGPAGTNIEILVTENNSEAGDPGKQSVSLVNGLYYADSLGQIMQTEINCRMWWQLRDGGGPYTDGNMSSSLYGWRLYGEYGVVNWPNGSAVQYTNRFPTFFAAELLHHFIGGGDTVVSATSDLPLVSAYGALRTNGNLTLMLLNKSPTNYYEANILLSNCLPGATATVYSYGMPQDAAAKAANNNCDITTNTVSASANFNYTLAPYSINVVAFTLAPAAPSLSVLPPSGPGQFVLQLAGQPGVPYVLQTSPDLSNWTSVSTNVLTGNVLDVTNPITSGTGAQFWRAGWFP